MVNGIKNVVKQEAPLVDVRKTPVGAAQLMRHKGVEYAVVHDRGLLVGVVSRKDLDHELDRHGRERSLRRLAKYKGTIRADASLDEAVKILRKRNTRVLAVLDGNRVVGIVRPAD
jgi:CBS domain-containing protein